MKVSVEGPVHAFGCGITPTGWAALLGVDASGMINRVVDAHDVFGRDVLRRATRALVAGPDMAAMAKIGEALIGTLVDRPDGRARAFVRHVDARLAGGVPPRHEGLVALSPPAAPPVGATWHRLQAAPPH